MSLLVEIVDHIDEPSIAWSVGSYELALERASITNDIGSYAIACILSGKSGFGVCILELLISTICYIIHHFSKDFELSTQSLSDNILLTFMNFSSNYSNTIDKLNPEHNEVYSEETIGLCVECFLRKELFIWLTIGLLTNDKAYHLESRWISFILSYLERRKKKLRISNLEKPRKTSESEESIQDYFSNGISRIGSMLNLRTPKIYDIDENLFRNLLELVSSLEENCGEGNPGELSLEDSLLVQFSDHEKLYISTVTFFLTHRFRSAITGSTKLLRILPNNVLLLFIRSISALQVGSYHVLSHDALLLASHSIPLVSFVGHSLAAYGIPMSSSRFIIQSNISDKKEHNYCYALSRYVQLVKTMQRGNFNTAFELGRELEGYYRIYGLGSWIMDMMIICCVAIRNFSYMKSIYLNKYRQLYLYLVSSIGGGYHREHLLQPSSSKFSTTIQELLRITKANSGHVLLIEDIYQRLPIHVTRAKDFADNRKFIQAWDEICCAVACVDEFLGSPLFAFSECAPHRVFFMGITIGLDLIKHIIDCTKENVTDLDTEFHDPCLDISQNDNRIDEIDPILTTVLMVSKTWMNQLMLINRCGVITVYANFRLFLAQHPRNALDRIAPILEDFTDSILIHDLIARAYASDFFIVKAENQSKQNIQLWPHVLQIAKTYEEINHTSGTYYYMYRKVLLLNFTPRVGRWMPTQWGSVITIAMCLMHLLFFGFTFFMLIVSFLTDSESLLNLSCIFDVPYGMAFSIACPIIVYAILSTVTSTNLAGYIMDELNFCNTRINRFLFALRGIPIINTINIFQILLKNSGNGLPSNKFLLILLFLIFPCTYVPFLTRFFLLQSIDVPKASFIKWCFIWVIDTIAATIFFPIHFLTVIFEPFFHLLFCFSPVYTTDINNRSKDLFCTLSLWRKELTQSTEKRKTSFLYIYIVKLLFFSSHRYVEKRDLIEVEMSQDDYLAFPLFSHASTTGLPDEL